MIEKVHVKVARADRAKTATVLLEAARELGYDASVVESMSDGYRAPEDVLELVYDRGTAAPDPQDDGDADADADSDADDGPPPPPIDSPDNKTEGRPVPPPRSGKGSSVEAWAAYAADLGVDYETPASRDEIIAALEAAGKPITTDD